ncbi:MAG: hypothetical protein EA382_17985 [Spirochaetaceae bacterium]|nr:MAG: hypothetical protein EA382_17985 [Spirochaetaceae bacterium]
MKRSIWRRVRTAVTIAAVAVVVSGCVDVVQYISGSGSTIDVYLRFALQKSAFEMANAFSDQPQNLDQMFAEEFNLERAQVLATLPEGIAADYRALNTEFEYGFELSYSADRDVLARVDGAGAFVPRIGPSGMSIPLAESSGGGDGGEGDQFAAAFLGGAKYRVFVSRRLVSRVSSARLVTAQQAIDVSVVELPDVWMIEFPVSLWLMAAETPTLEVVF